MAASGSSGTTSPPEMDVEDGKLYEARKILHTMLRLNDQKVQKAKNKSITSPPPSSATKKKEKVKTPGGHEATGAGDGGKDDDKKDGCGGGGGSGGGGGGGEKEKDIFCDKCKRKISPKKFKKHVCIPIDG